MTLQEAIQLGFEHLRAGRLAQCELLCQNILAKIPDQPDAIQLLGILAQKAGRNDDAIALLQRAIQLAPQAAHFHSNTGVLLSQMGRVPDAIPYLRRAAELNPQLADNHSNLAAALLNVGDRDQAIDCLHRAVNLDPRHAAGLMNLASALFQTMRFEESAEICRRALQLWPDSYELLSNYGLTLTKLRRFDEACATFEKSLALDPQAPAARMNLAVAYQSVGEFDKAIVLLRRLLQTHTKDWGLSVYWSLNDVHRLKTKLASPGASISTPPPDRLPYLGDKVVLLHCDRITCDSLRRAGLHTGYVMDPDDGSECWLSAQLATQPDPAHLEGILEQWLQWMRNEAAMAGATCAVWLPSLPASIADAIRQIAGDSLIEIEAQQADEIHRQLQARAITPPDTDGKVFALLSIRNGGLELLPHWLEHYTQLGVDEILLGVFDDVASEHLAEIDELARRWKFRHFPQHWGTNAEMEQYAQREAGCRLAGALPGTWILHTDLDELHEFPAPLSEITAAAAKLGIDAIHGKFVDRLAEGGELPPVRDQPSLWKQFPLECKLTERFLQGGATKVMLARYRARVSVGHHNALGESIRSPLGPEGAYRVHHFKWHAGLLDRMRWSLGQENTAMLWTSEAARFMEWISRNGGRIDVSDPRLEVKPASRQS